MINNIIALKYQIMKTNSVTFKFNLNEFKLNLRKLKLNLS